MALLAIWGGGGISGYFKPFQGIMVDFLGCMWSVWGVCGHSGSVGMQLLEQMEWTECMD